MDIEGLGEERVLQLQRAGLVRSAPRPLPAHGRAAHRARGLRRGQRDSGSSTRSPRSQGAAVRAACCSRIGLEEVGYVTGRNLAQHFRTIDALHGGDARADRARRRASGPKMAESIAAQLADAAHAARSSPTCATLGLQLRERGPAARRGPARRQDVRPDRHAAGPHARAGDRADHRPPAGGSPRRCRRRPTTSSPARAPARSSRRPSASAWRSSTRPACSDCSMARRPDVDAGRRGARRPLHARQRAHVPRLDPHVAGAHRRRPRGRAAASSSRATAARLIVALPPIVLGAALALTSYRRWEANQRALRLGRAAADRRPAAPARRRHRRCRAPRRRHRGDRCLQPLSRPRDPGLARGAHGAVLAAHGAELHVARGGDARPPRRTARCRGCIAPSAVAVRRRGVDLALRAEADAPVADAVDGAVAAGRARLALADGGGRRGGRRAVAGPARLSRPRRPGRQEPRARRFGDCCASSGRDVAGLRRLADDALARAVRVRRRRVGDHVDLVEERRVVAGAAGDAVDLAVAGVERVVAVAAVERVADLVDRAARAGRARRRGRAPTGRRCPRRRR